jgi:hypothetical protein
VARMARLGVRSGALAFARPSEHHGNKRFCGGSIFRLVSGSLLNRDRAAPLDSSGEPKWTGSAGAIARVVVYLGRSCAAFGAARGRRRRDDQPVPAGLFAYGENS